MNPTTESVTAAGILNNHMPIRPHAAMNNVGTGDMHYGKTTLDLYFKIYFFLILHSIF